MPKLNEYFSPITKPSSENTSVLTNIITPVPIHANSTCNTIDQSPQLTTAFNGNFLFRGKKSFK